MRTASSILLILASAVVLTACTDPGLEALTPSAMPPTATATLPASAASTSTTRPGLPTVTSGAPAIGTRTANEWTLQEYDVPRGSRPHDVAPAADGGVWYTAQGAGALGWLDPATGRTRHIPLGSGSAPHGVIVGPDKAAWVTDSGLNAIVRVDPATDAVRVFPLPGETRNANLNTAAFDGQGILWFTGQSGFYGRLNPATGEVKTFPAPEGRGPYGIAATPAGDVYYTSLAGSYLARIDTTTGSATVLEPPTPGPRSTEGVVGLQGASVGERMERRTGGHVRSCNEGMERMAAAGGASASIRRVRR